MRTAWLLVGLLSATGCLRSSYRYADLPLPPAAAIQKIEADANAEGLTDRKLTCPALVCDRDAPTDALEGSGGSTAFRVDARGSGSRVTIAGSTVDVVPVSLAAAPRVTITPAPHEDGWSDVIVFDWELSGALEREPGGALGWRTNYIGQVGGRVAHWGGLGDVPRPGYSLSVLGGAGLAIASTGASLLPEVTLSLDRQALVEPVAGTRIPMGHRDALDLAIAGRLLDDEKDVAEERVSSRSGLEAALTLRRVGLGGITARLGYLWGPGGGTTMSVGVRALSAKHAAIASAIVAGAAALVEIATHPPTLTLSEGLASGVARRLR